MLKLKNSNKILIIRLSSLGDVLLTTPVIREIKTKYPKIKIDFLVRNNFSDVYKYNPILNKLYEYKNDNAEELISILKKNNYDLIIDLQNSRKSRRLVRKLKCPRVRFKKHNFKKFLFVRLKINLLKSIDSIPERYAESLPGILLDNYGLDIFIPHSIKSVLSDNEKYIGICPGSKHFSKRYPKEYFIELAKMLISENYKIVLFGGKDDKIICYDISRELPNAINLSNNNNLLQTAEDMKKCEIVLCNDSGLMHTAVATKTPVAVFYGSTIREFGFFPYNCEHIIFENNLLTCRPCSHIGLNKCPKKHFKCMTELTPNNIFNELIEFIQFNKK
ncbi:MAG: glycosyltransferase family 9 protein [Ignavibacteriales bacterium]|nr:glycosyltransferase family 9 protein [Ignavibacteriales bacterium]